MREDGEDIADGHGPAVEPPVTINRTATTVAPKLMGVRIF
jgi:hypothetical protein